MDINLSSGHLIWQASYKRRSTGTSLPRLWEMSINYSAALFAARLALASAEFITSAIFSSNSPG